MKVKELKRRERFATFILKLKRGGIMNLNKNDFYYGALLSKLVNSGFAPAIVEKEVKDARLYLVSNDYGDYSIYTKYISNADANRKNEKGGISYLMLVKLII